MRPKSSIIVLPLFLLCMGCPETWGKGGKMDQAMEKDIKERLRKNNCPLDEEEWAEICSDPDPRIKEALGCPQACQ
ncbi:hypothetical protein F0U61_03755 [Archangium violaceum]|uniref:hypothetical protein n=1 Tax=Archangium violaceum TaxID=83451 RepID=UPI002B2DFA91|nr:hypothetical protein F0U61_03755 [Archangium violaceum]